MNLKQLRLILYLGVFLFFPINDLLLGDMASSRDPGTGRTTTSVANPDGTHTVTVTDRDGRPVSTETVDRFGNTVPPPQTEAPPPDDISGDIADKLDQIDATGNMVEKVINADGTTTVTVTDSNGNPISTETTDRSGNPLEPSQNQDPTPDSTGSGESEDDGFVDVAREVFEQGGNGGTLTGIGLGLAEVFFGPGSTTETERRNMDLNHPTLPDSRSPKPESQEDSASDTQIPDDLTFQNMNPVGIPGSENGTRLNARDTLTQGTIEPSPSEKKAGNICL